MIQRRSGSKEHRAPMKQFLIIMLALIIVGSGLWVWTELKNPRKMVTRNLLLSKILEENKQREEFFSVQLFFASKMGFSLGVETREVKGEKSSLQQQIRRALAELIKGPTQADLVPTIPVGTKLRGFYLDKNGIGYADFSNEMIKNHPGGSWGELITIYSVVNTVIKNFPQVRQVKLLINGLEVETLRGHLDLRRAFSFNESLLSKQP